MRIISGKYKGRNLVSFMANHIRPTMDRVKETIFNKWMMSIAEAKVLDLFAGTGNLGLEALSRDASHVTFVEKNGKSLHIIRQNIKILKILDKDYDLFQTDVFDFLKKKQKHEFDLIFIDPPFTEKLAHSVMMAISESSIFSNDTRIVIESVKQEVIENEYGSLVCYDRLDYGDKKVSFFKKKD